jgi:TPR repeat protein
MQKPPPSRLPKNLHVPYSTRLLSSRQQTFTSEFRHGPCHSGLASVAEPPDQNLKPPDAQSLFQARELVHAGDLAWAGFDRIDFALAQECFHEALALGYAPAAAYLAGMFHFGMGCIADKERACLLGEQSCRLGITELASSSWNAQNRDAGHVFAALAFLLSEGIGMSKNSERAYELYVAAAELGHTSSINNVGTMLLRGCGVAKDETEGAIWIARAASLGNAFAECNLARLMEKGIGMPKNLDQAVKLYSSSASKGCPDALNFLGRLHYDGHGVEKDFERAATLFIQAAEQHNAQAQANLASLYWNGQGVPYDTTQAVKWYQSAAEHGDASAQCRLAWMYQEGQGTPQDLGQAVVWYRKAADQDNSTAQRILGWMYANGVALPRDEDEAVKWYRRASLNGDVKAQIKLSDLYKANAKQLRELWIRFDLHTTKCTQKIF